MSNLTSKPNKLLKIVKAIEASLLDAKVSRSMFQRELSNASPAPISLRIYFKAFIYSFHEVIDFAMPHGDANGDAPAKKLAELLSFTSTCPTIQYIKEARDSISHNPHPIIEAHGGWQKVQRPEMNSDGTFNLPHGHDHIPGSLVLSDTPKSQNKPSVPLPNHHSDHFSNAEISEMMDSSIASIEPIVLELAFLASQFQALPHAP